MRRPCVRQGLFSTLRIPLPYFDPVICRSRKDSCAGKIDMEHSNAIRVSRFELFRFGRWHGSDGCSGRRKVL